MVLLLIDNAIGGLDFSPLGTAVASIDKFGVCLISDVSTNDYSYDINTSSEGMQK